MQPPVDGRAFTPAAHRPLTEGLRASDAFTLRRVEPARAAGDPEPHAWCCDGVRRTARPHTRLRVVEGRPVRHGTTACLGRLVPQRAAEPTPVWGRMGDYASWPVSREGRPWMRQRHQPAKRHGGVRRLTCRVPGTRPWRNPLEARWVPGTRAVVEPARLRTAPEVSSRVWADGATALLEPLQQQVA
jgi:hypothetical protein